MNREPPMTRDELERHLRRLSEDVAFPSTPDLAPAVRAALDQRALPPTRALPPWWGRGARTALAASVALLLLAATLLTMPPARAVVGDWLDAVDLPGVRIELGDDAAPETPRAEGAVGSAVGMTLLLGEPVTLAEAAGRLPFTLLTPDAAALGAPDEVYLRQVEGGAFVSLLYLPRPGLPEIGTTGVGALLMQFRTAEQVNLLVKEAMGPEGVAAVRVGAAEGFWVRTGRLTVLPPDPSRISLDDARRPSGNVLLWATGGVTYRLETALDRGPAVALAAGLVPFGATPEASSAPERDASDLS